MEMAMMVMMVVMVVMMFAVLMFAVFVLVFGIRVGQVAGLDGRGSGGLRNGSGGSRLCGFGGVLFFRLIRVLRHGENS